MINVRRVIHENAVYTPLFFDDQMLDLDQLALLAITEHHQPIRRIRCVIATQEKPRSEFPALDLTHGKFEIPPELPLVFSDTRFIVGKAEETHVEERQIVATFRLLNTRLAEIVWRAIRDGTLDGLCPVVVDAVDNSATGLCVQGKVCSRHSRRFIDELFGERGHPEHGRNWVRNAENKPLTDNQSYPERRKRMSSTNHGQCEETTRGRPKGEGRQEAPGSFGASKTESERWHDIRGWKRPIRTRPAPAGGE